MALPQPLEHASAFAHCEALVRQSDPDRYLASLFVPADKRPHVLALYAFSLEIARIRELVSEPLPGEMRQQWWRDALGEEGARGDVAAHPVASALLATIDRFRLPRGALIDLIDARVFDLYDDLFPAVTDLEGYCGETSSALMRLITLILADGGETGPADASGHAGVAYAITGLLRAFPWHARRGQVYIPKEILARTGAERSDIVAGRRTPALDAALAEMRALARTHFERAEAVLPAVPAGVRPAFLPAFFVPAYLARMEGRAYDPFQPVEVPQWRKQWLLWRNARRLG